MTISTIDESQRQAAKIAGFNLVFAMAIVIFAQYYVAGNLIVPRNAVETAQNILAHETRFRITIAFNLLYVASIAALLAALYVILSPVNRGLALAAAFCRLIFDTMWAIAALNMLDALTFLGNAPYLRAFPQDQLQAFASVHMHGVFDAYYVGLPFFSLASTICSYLFFKSRYIPRALAGFGVISSAWCVICAFIFVIFPHFNETLNDYWFDSPMALFDLALGFWLMFKGLRSSPSDSHAGIEIG